MSLHQLILYLILRLVQGLKVQKVKYLKLHRVLFKGSYMSNEGILVHLLEQRAFDASQELKYCKRNMQCLTSCNSKTRHYDAKFCKYGTVFLWLKYAIVALFFVAVSLYFHFLHLLLLIWVLEKISSKVSEVATFKFQSISTFVLRLYALFVLP